MPVDRAHDNPEDFVLLGDRGAPQIGSQQSRNPAKVRAGFLLRIVLNLSSYLGDREHLVIAYAQGTGYVQGE